MEETRENKLVKLEKLKDELKLFEEIKQIEQEKKQENVRS